jgi:ATP-dependent RNA helicase DDX18/HAS1
MSAKEAFKAFVRAYDCHQLQLQAMFNIQTLDLGKLALSFGLKVPPIVDLSEYFEFFSF